MHVPVPQIPAVQSSMLRQPPEPFGSYPLAHVAHVSFAFVVHVTAVQLSIVSQFTQVVLLSHWPVRHVHV